jgi:crotonobetainyl-CoA:carnitine CoA-transferase CaiB-like acyl-CoA transferase
VNDLAVETSTDSDSSLLEGVVVLDMSQFLSGPFAALRLGDLGARVIKIERPDGGDLCRRLYLSDTELGGDSTLFHAINRGKESFAADFKSAEGLAAIKKLIAHADIVIQNFRPGVIERLGLDYERARAINPRIVYASITGYGDEGPWRALPGQDLLAQARSGVMWLNGDEEQGPVPFGLAVADLLAGNAIVQGVLAALVRSRTAGKGAHIQTSLLEALVDFQFEVLATHLNDGGRMPKRSNYRNAHAYLSAPYGVYRTADSWLALAMTPLDKLAPLLEMQDLANLPADAPFRQRDAIKRQIADKIATRTAADWLARLQPHDIWCSEVLNWSELFASENFKLLDMVQELRRDDGVSIRTMRSPIRVNGRRGRSNRAAPRIGENTAALREEFDL